MTELASFDAPSTPRKSRSSTPFPYMLSWTLTTTARQPVVWGRLWGRRSLPVAQAASQKCLVRPSGQAPHPANNRRLTAAVALPTWVHGKSPQRAKADIWDMTGQERPVRLPAPSLLLHMNRRCSLMVRVMRGVTVRLRPENWQQLKMDLTAAPRQT